MPGYHNQTAQHVFLVERGITRTVRTGNVQHIPRNMHTVFALLCFVVVVHRLIFPYPSGLLHWHCGNRTIAPVPAKQPWWIGINTSCEFIMNDCLTTTKQSTAKPCVYFLGYTVWDRKDAIRVSYDVCAGLTIWWPVSAPIPGCLRAAYVNFAGYLLHAKYLLPKCPLGASSCIIG